MSDLIYYLIYAGILITFIMGILVYKKMNILKLILMIITLFIVIVWRFFFDMIPFKDFEYINEVYDGFLILVLFILALTFRRKIRVTKNLTDHDFFELEKKLESVNDSSELLRKRFVYAINLLSEGLIFYETDYSGLYITDQVKSLIDTDRNDLSMDEYTSLIHDEDRKMYINTIKKLTEKKMEYDIKYRVQSKNRYAWIREKGSLFRHDKRDHIISTIKPVNIKLFPETMIDELDSLPLEDDLTKNLSNLKKEKSTFYLVMLHLTNIPDVNKRFGRDVGNLMIAEYVKNMRYHFAREKNTLFRLTGIQFALIIKDDIKYQNLHRALTSGGDLINLKLNIGGIQQIIYPNVGVMKYDPWSQMTVDDLLTLSNKSLEEAISDNKNNYSFFGGE
jgi:GGDEF domain-containing protein